MCYKHSFIVTKDNKVFHGYGLIESHTSICNMFNLNEDSVNKYEYDPNKTNFNYLSIKGLDGDSIVFLETNLTIKSIESHIKKYFPTLDNFTNYDLITKNPSIEVQKLAVKQNGYAIDYITNPSIEVQKLAVKQNGYAIKYITNPSIEVQKLAVKQNGYAIDYIANPSIEVQKLAVKQNGYAIRFITNPSIEVQKLAVKQNGYAIKYITNPSIEVQKLAKQNM